MFFSKERLLFFDDNVAVISDMVLPFSIKMDDIPKYNKEGKSFIINGVIIKSSVNYSSFGRPLCYEADIKIRTVATKKKRPSANPFKESAKTRN